MFKSFKPINDNILVKLIEKEKTTTGGIIIPDQAQEKTSHAIVVHAGKSDQLVVGDNIFFKKYMGTILDPEYLVLKQEDILGIL